MTAGNGTGDSPAAGDAMAAGTSSAAGATRTVTNVVLAGLGGQGVIKASDILADAALRAGFDVKKAEIHGMSQRGGSVTSDVRFGRKVLSPMVPRGTSWRCSSTIFNSAVCAARPATSPSRRKKSSKCALG